MIDVKQFAVLAHQLVELSDNDYRSVVQKVRNAYIRRNLALPPKPFLGVVESYSPLTQLDSWGQAKAIFALVTRDRAVKRNAADRRKFRGRLDSRQKYMTAYMRKYRARP